MHLLWTHLGPLMRIRREDERSKHERVCNHELVPSNSRSEMFSTAALEVPWKSLTAFFKRM